MDTQMEVSHSGKPEVPWKGNTGHGFISFNLGHLSTVEDSRWSFRHVVGESNKSSLLTVVVLLTVGSNAASVEFGVFCLFFTVRAD